MLANKFGASINGKLIIYDNYDIHNYLSLTCNRNPEFSSYCFDSSFNLDGDSVKIMVYGFMMTFVNDVSL